MTDLISKLYKRPSVESYTDISFKLPDGGTVQVRVVKKIFWNTFVVLTLFPLGCSDFK